MRYLGWFLAGSGSVLSFQLLFVLLHGGDWSVLVRVGADRPQRLYIENELGPVTCLDPLGHDGQMNYLIGRDPFDRRDTSALINLVDNSPYRYRRILYPLLAGGCGLLGPQATVCGLLFWFALGGGLIAASSAYLCAEWKLPGTAMLFVLLNPGIYLSAQGLTNDVLALGLALAGVVFWKRHLEFVAGFLLAAAVLVRETSVLISLSLALTVLCQRGVRPALFLAAGSSLPFFGWALWVKWAIPGGNGFENLNPPFVGLYRSLFLWHQAADVVFGCVTVLLLIVSVLVAWKTDQRFIRFTCLAWLGLAMILSPAVWGEPGNALRAISPLWAFVALGYGTCRSATVSCSLESPRRVFG